jgi:hypothetical protein
MAVKQRQSQKQNVNVTVNLGEKKKKGKPKKRKTGKKRREGTQPLIIPSFNPPSIINYPPFFNQYNQKPNTFLNPPPPLPQKQYATFPEAETAPLSGILSTVPTILKLQTTEPEPNLAKATVKESEVQPFAPEVETSPFTTEAEEPAPTFFNEPETTTPIGGGVETNIEPLLTPAEEESYKQLTSQYRAAELPIGLSPEETQRKEEEARGTIAKLGARFKAKKAAALPEEPPSPSGSSISNITEEPVFLGAPSPSFFNVEGLKLPPLNLPPRQQIIGAEEILNPPSLAPPAPEFLFTEGQTGRTGTTEYSAPLTAKKRTGTLADFGLGVAPAEAKEEAPLTLEKKRGGRPKGSTNKPKISEKQTQFALPAKGAVIGEAIPTYELGLPIAEQPNIQFLGGTQKTFLAEPAPPLASISGGIERRRGAAAIPAAEEDILLKQSTIPTLFTQRSQTTL